MKYHILEGLHSLRKEESSQQRLCPLYEIEPQMMATRKDPRAAQKRFSSAKSKIFFRWVETDGCRWIPDKKPGKPSLRNISKHREKL